jgi:hypothetical protein
LEKGDQNESVPHPRKERKLRRDEMKAHKKNSSQTPGIVSFQCKRQ